MSNTAFELIVLLGWPVPFVGLVLFVRGLRGRRNGDEPRCRKCGYNLTGVASNRCPECGRELTDRGRVWGTRRLRWRSIAAGSVLLLFSLVTLWQYIHPRALAGIRRGDHYAYYPTSWLVRSANANPKRIGEILLQRLERGELSRIDDRDVVDLALTQQDASVQPGPWEWILVLSYNSNRMSEVQADRYRDQLLTVELGLEETIEQVDRLDCRLQVTSMIPLELGQIYTGSVREVRLGRAADDAAAAPDVSWFAAIPVDWRIYRIAQSRYGELFPGAWSGSDVGPDPFRARVCIPAPVEPGYLYVQVSGEQYISTECAAGPCESVFWAKPFAATARTYVMDARYSGE